MMLKKLKYLYPHQTLISIFIIGLVIIASSLIIEHGFGIKPCEMCFWQRYLAIGITIVAFSGTLFRGRIKKLFLATISILAFVSMGVGLWQSLAQEGIVGLPGVCQPPVIEKTATDGQALLADLKENKVEYIDCSIKEDFFLNNIFGISLANVNTILMLLIGSFSFYKLFFKPRKRFRRYNNRRNYRNNHNNNRNRTNNNNNRRYRGSGYRRSHNRNRRPDNNNNRYNNNNER